MIVRRGTRPKSGFYILAHSIAEDNRLSWEARGVLVFLLVKPDDWQVSVAHLVKQGHAGRDKVYGILQELMGAGYATREQVRGSGKFGDTAYIIHELPLPAFQEAVAPLTENQEAAPLTDSPHTDLPYTANPTLVNNHLQQELKEKLHGPQAAQVGPAETILKAVKGLYPKREGSHRWPDALKHIRARLREGHTSDEMLAGAERYAAFCRVKEILGSSLVQQGATFFGNNKGFLEAWEVQRSGGSGKTEVDAANEKLDRDVLAARATAKRLGFRQQMRGEPPETFVARIDREHSDQLAEQLREQDESGGLSKLAKRALANAKKTGGEHVKEPISTCQYEDFVERMWIGGKSEAMTELARKLRRAAGAPLGSTHELLTEAADTIDELNGLRDLFIMTTGLGGETGEVLEKLKKLVRDGTFDQAALQKELGDQLYYLTKVAKRHGLSLQSIMAANIDKLEGRKTRGTTGGSGDDR